MKSLILVLCLLTGPVFAGEDDYVKQHCTGDIEHVLPDRTRVDCLLPHIVQEYDWAHKWYEGIGQALHYSVMTGRSPGLVLIVTDADQCRYVERARRVGQANCPKVDVTTVGVSCYK